MMTSADPGQPPARRRAATWMACLVLGLAACSEWGGSRLDVIGTRLGPSSALSVGRPSAADAGRARGGRALELLDTHETGVFNQGAAEIVDYHPATRRAFVVNSRAARVAVLELGARGFRRGERSLEPRRDLANFDTGEVTSLAVEGDLVAVAVCAASNDQRGRVAFYSARELSYLGSVVVGYVPDMLTFTPDGRRVLVANEGEQRRDQAQRITVDPEGSVSIIDVSQGVEQASVSQATFDGFDARVEEYRNAGVRIPRVGDSYFASGEGQVRLSTDVEPEYIAVAADGKTAWVSLQENDAVAVLDLTEGRFTDILPLGVKDFSRGVPAREDLALPLLGAGNAGEPLGLWGSPTANPDQSQAFDVLLQDSIAQVVLDAGRTTLLGSVPLERAAGAERRLYRGLARDIRHRGYWVGDAEHPTLYRFTAEGRLCFALPLERSALGVAAIALDAERQRIYALLGDADPQAPDGSGRLVRIVGIDADATSPSYGKPLGEWLHWIDPMGHAGSPAVVTGAALESDGRLLVLERSTAVGAKARVLRIDLAGASDVLARGGAPARSLSGQSADELVEAQGIRFAHQQALFALPGRADGSDGGVGALALLQDGRIAVATGGTERPAPAGAPGSAAGARALTAGLVLVHFDDQNRFDASDRDGRVTLRHWPVLGGYMPDGIASLHVGGQDYFVTANEGDTRDYDAKRLADIELDPVRFPDAAALQARGSLGRLKISAFDGDLDGDGDFDEIHAFGARSLSVWDAAGDLVFDTGSLFEEVTALASSSAFNSNNDDNGSFDTRSDDKGPEPEGLAVAEIDGHPYAFVGLERVGGIVVLDLSDPRAPSFVEYVNPRDFEGSAARGSARDLGPEGLKFVPAAQSPTGRGLLLVANEVSGTTSVYDVNL